VPICRWDDIADPGSRGIDGRDHGLAWDFFVVRSDDRAFAYLNRCPHTGAPLDWMPDQFLDSDGALIQCAVHGALFRVEDGLCLHGPCLGGSLTSVAVEIVDGVVCLSMGSGPEDPAA
jgi:nitrite reductase/ring-hydroxylating ferredoxin subunit